MVNSLQVCDKLRESGATFDSFARNPVRGLNFVLSAFKKQGTGIKVYSNLDPEIHIDTKHKQAVINANEDARTLQGKKVVSLATIGVFSPSITREQLTAYIRRYMEHTIAIPTAEIDIKLKSTMVSLKAAVQNISVRLTTRSFRHIYNKVFVEFEYSIFVPAITTNALVGIDETAHFICILPKTAESVEHAHEILRPEGVPPGSLRQGEFFFVPADPEEILNLIGTSITDENGDIHWVETSSDIPLRAFSTHRAERGIGLSLSDSHEEIYQVNFVKGLITDRRKGHHVPLNLPTWHKVYRNTELTNEDLPPHMRKRARYYD